MKAVFIPRQRAFGWPSLLPFILCSIFPALFVAEAAAQTSLPGYTPPAALNSKTELSPEEKAQRGVAPLSQLRSQIKLDAVRVHRLPALSGWEMQPERRSGRLRIGAVQRLERALGIASDGALFHLPEGRLHLLRVATEGAALTRLHFNQVKLPEGARLFVYSRSSPDDYHALHIANDDGLNVLGQSEFWTPPMIGDEVVVEYLVPAGLDERASASLPFAIDQVSHIFHDPRSTDATQQGGAAT